MFFVQLTSGNDILGVMLLMFCFVGFSALESWRCGIKNKKNQLKQERTFAFKFSECIHYHLVEVFSKRDY